MLITNDTLILKWRRKWELSVIIHILGCIFCIVMLTFFMQNDNRKIFLILFLIGIGVNIIIYIYNLVWGLNRIIYIDKESIKSKILKKRYEWRWDEITNIQIFQIPFRIPMVIVKIKTKEKYKTLSFSLSYARYKKLLKICPNLMVTSKLQRYFM